MIFSNIKMNRYLQVEKEEQPMMYILNEQLHEKKNKKSKCPTIGCDGLGNLNTEYSTHSCLKSCPNKVKKYNFI